MTGEQTMIADDKLYAVKTLGRFSCRRKGEKLLADHKLGKVHELFMYLLTSKKPLIPREEVQEVLWPDTPAELSAKALNHNIYMLRNTLEGKKVARHDSIIKYTHGCYCFNENQQVDLDTVRFEAALMQAAAEKTVGLPYRAIAFYEEALQIYGGDYLPELNYTDWVIPARQHYKKTYLNNLYNLIELYKAEKMPQEIVATCERAFYHEPLDEELHCYYIEALVECGHHSQARNHYSYITETLYNELEVRPSPAIRRLYKIIRSDPHEYEMSFRDIYALLRLDQEEGPVNCDPHCFTVICKIEKQRLQVESNCLDLFSLNLTDKEFAVPSAEVVGDAMAVLRRIIKNNLGSNDLYTRWSRAQYLVLLVADKDELNRQKLKTIKKEFAAHNSCQELVLRASHFNLR
jgi:DNA-binding SARP family transcriptional activator